MKSSNLVRLSLGLVAVSSVALVGCGSSNNRRGGTSALTPELITLNQRPVDAADARAITFNSNWREMWDDINRGLLLDRPSRLSPMPIAH